MNILRRSSHWLVLIALLLPCRAQNTPFDSGSRGTQALTPTGDTNIFLPPDGRLEFTRIEIPVGVTVTFERNANNTPVYLLAQGDVIIRGTINVAGEHGSAANRFFANRPGRGGPGGFDGGMPGVGGSAPGDGLGPGGGRGAVTASDVGRGIYGAPFDPAAAKQNDGQPYGTRLLMPLLGGSGGGGTPASGGGGGGGAILIASSTSIQIPTGGIIDASAGGGGGLPNWGSGGAIRLVAPIIAGEGALRVSGFGAQSNFGRIRCDTLDRSNFRLSISPSPAAAVTTEAFMVVTPPNLPRLRVVQVGNVIIPETATGTVNVLFPINTASQLPIRVHASGFCAQVPVTIRLVPATGPAIELAPLLLDNATTDPAVGQVTANFPPNVAVTVEAFIR